MSQRIDSFIIREADGVRTANSLVLGQGLRITETAGGLPELEGVHGSEVLLSPSGGDDTQAVNDALATGKDVRLGSGTFTISDTLVVGTGGSQRLGGSGADRTQVRLTTAGIPAVLVVSGHCTLERLLLNGVSYGSGKTGIRAVFPSGFHVSVAIRDMRIHGMGEAIHLENAACDVSGVDVTWGGEYGIYARGLRGTLRNLSLDTVDGFGIHVENGEGVVCESIHVSSTVESGIRVVRGTGCRLSAIRLIGVGGPGLYIDGAQALAADSLFVMSTGFGDGIWLSQARHVTLNGCVVGSPRSGLLILESENVVAGALQTQATIAGLFVRNSPGVFITGMRVLGGSVDVSQAGSRVLFGPNNTGFPSGGNFAAL